MKPTMLLFTVVLVFTSGCPFLGPAEFIPEPDACNSPRALDGIESVEIGHLEGDTFVAWADGQQVELTYGPQGGAMLGVVVSIRGRNLPACMSQSMTLATDMTPELASSSEPVNTYEEADGTRTTKPIWMILYGPEPLPGDPVDVTLNVGDIEVRRAVVIL